MCRCLPGLVFCLALSWSVVTDAGQATWTTTFPYGGIIRPGGLVVAPESARTLYCLPLWRGLYRSENGAGSWNSQTDDGELPFDVTNLPWIAVGDDPANLWLLAYGYGGRDEGLFRSRDGGRRWELSAAGVIPDLVTALAIHPVDRRRVFVGTVSGGVFASDDRGDTWASIGEGLPAARVRRLVVGESGNGTLYAAMHGRGLFTRPAGAATWHELASGGILDELSDLLVHPATPGRLLAVGGEEYGEPALLLRSEDGGVTWVDVGIPTSGPARSEPGRRLAVSAQGPDMVYAVLGDDLWRSADGGLSWQLSAFSDGRTVVTVVIAPDDPRTVYAGTTGGVYVSHDGGLTWAFASDGMRAVTHIHSAAHGLAYDRTEPSVIYSGASRGPRTGAFRSTDGGVTWEPMDYPGEGVRSFDGHPAAPGVVFAYHNLVHRSSDRGDTWEELAAELCCYGGGDLRVEPSDPSVLYLATSRDVGTPGVYRSDDAGVTWRSTDEGRLGYIHTLAVDPVHPGAVYAATGESFPVLRLDGGRFEVLVEWAVPGGNSGYARPVSLTDDSGYFWFFAEDNVELVVKLLDGCPVNDRFWVFLAGLTNVEVRLVVTDTATASEKVYSNPAGEPFQPIQDTGAFATCDDGEAGLTASSPLSPAMGADLASDPLSGLFKTTDGGATWTALSGGLPSQLNVDQVVVHPLDPQRVLLGSATHNGGVYGSRDGGRTWTLLLEDNVNTVAVDPTDPDVIYVGTWNTTGFHRSHDGGVTWETFNDGLPQRAGINALAVDPTDPLHLLAGTTGGVYEIDLPAPEKTLGPAPAAVTAPPRP